MSPEQDLIDKITTGLRAVIDPEVGLNVVDLGLIYGIRVIDDEIQIKMTMTTPSCPMTEYLHDRVSDMAWLCHPDAKSVDVELVWEPLWEPSMIAEESRGQLGWPA